MVDLLKEAMTILVALLLSTIVFAELAPIRVERQVTADAKPGQTVQVKLLMKFVGDKPSGIIVNEYLPKGWELAGAVPSATSFEDRVSWVVYGGDIDKPIVYELKAPNDTSKLGTMHGTWETVTESGVIEGDIVVNFEQEKKQETQQQVAQPPAAQARQDNTILYVGGAIVVLLLIVIVLQVRKKK